MASLSQRILSQFTLKKAQYRLRQLRNWIQNPRTIWEENISEEIDFWRDTMTNPASQYYNTFRQDADPQRPLRPEIQQLLAGAGTDDLRLFDVGAGPITQLGFVWEGHTFHIDATDALADKYALLWQEASMTPPVATQACHAEDIATHYEAGSYDLVYCRNALDHMYDPMTVIHQMVQLAKPGGLVYLVHIENEGKRSYEGLHQWNVSNQAGRFVLWNTRQRYDVAHELGAMLADIEVTSKFHEGHGRNLVSVVMRKATAH